MWRDVKVISPELLKDREKWELIIGLSNPEVTDERDKFSFTEMMVKKAWLEWI